LPSKPKLKDLKPSQNDLGVDRQLFISLSVASQQCQIYFLDLKINECVMWNIKNLCMKMNHFSHIKRDLIKK
jgi:hypothetical protein